ncbi:Phage protein [Staphylococcus aureus]|nr:Phage protein [Staphylococcus aureus]
MYNRKEIREMIDNYKWMKNIIDSKVYDNESTSIAQYGYQSAMPKAKGTTSNKVLVKVINKNKALRKYDYLIKKIAFIDEYEEYITNEKDYHILQMLKQRESHNRVMSILDIGRDNFYSRVKDIVNILYNLQQGGHIIVWFGLTWSLELYQQANARLYRQGQNHTTIIHHIMTDNTIDQRVYKALQNKELTQEELMKAIKARIAKHK